MHYLKIKLAYYKIPLSTFPKDNVHYQYYDIHIFHHSNSGSIKFGTFPLYSTLWLLLKEVCTVNSETGSKGKQGLVLHRIFVNTTLVLVYFRYQGVWQGGRGGRVIECFPQRKEIKRKHNIYSLCRGQLLIGRTYVRIQYFVYNARHCFATGVSRLFFIILQI